MRLPKNQFPECEGCINASLDPFQCQTCKKGSNYEGEELSDSELASDPIDEHELHILFGDL